MIKILLYSILALSVTANGQSLDTLPINPDTKKVSITKVVEITNASKDEIYSRINDWYQLKLNGIKQVSTTKKNDKEGEPQLVGIWYFNWDPNNLDSLSKNRQKLMYKIALAQLMHGTGPFGAKEASGYEHATLVILIKDGKIKYEFTEFFHEVVGDGRGVTFNSGDLWPFERKFVIISDKNWLKVRLEAINKYGKLGDEFVEYIKKPSRTDMDF